ncbi:unnamed protein product [Rhizoctonia solani]|uniref:Uncharacterized protein n=1 Tax=Rhizoctonia solani TaxID=456999 RepID=A0A8H2W750_9AGAM|nr:unnamed protein product [Rhizoctonia solani]
MVSARFVALLTLLSAGTRMAVLGLKVERRWKDVGDLHFEALGSSGDDQATEGEVDFSDCVAIPVIMTITITDIPASSPTVSPNRSVPTAICSRLAKNSSSMTGAIHDSRLFVPGMPHHLNPLPGEAYIPVCQDPIVLPTLTDSPRILPSGSGRHKIIRPTPDSYRAPEEASTLLFAPVSSPWSALASPAHEPTRSHLLTPENIFAAPPVITQGVQDELPLFPLEKVFVRDVD